MQQNTEAWKRWVKKSKEEDKHFQEEGFYAKTQAADLNTSNVSKKSVSTNREPFVYNYKPKVAKTSVKETNR